MRHIARRFNALFRLLVGVWLLVGTTLWAAGTLTGKVLVSGGRVAIPGALVAATGPGGTFTATSGSSGTYTLSLPGATYTVACTAAGFLPATQTVAVAARGRTRLDFALTRSVVTLGSLSGTVTHAGTGLPLGEASVSLSPGTLQTRTDAAGHYAFAGVTAGTYTMTVALGGFATATRPVTVTAGGATLLDVALVPDPVRINRLTAAPAVFAEGAAAEVALTAEVADGLESWQWSQVKGPKVPMNPVDARTATLDVHALQVAVDTELVFRLTVTGADQATSSKDVSVFVEPADMFPVLGPNIQIGGSTVAVQKFADGGVDWAVYNIGSRFCVTPIGAAKGAVHSIYVPGAIQDIDLVSFNDRRYALVSAGTVGIVVVDLSVPTAPAQHPPVPVNYYQDGITFTEGGGDILAGNIISSDHAPVVALATDGASLYIADPEYGIHKTALSNLLAGPVTEADGTLKIDQEKFVLQYAGENPWGGPVDLMAYGTRLFVCMKELGLGIFDAATLDQVGRYNLYTDPTVKEDWFIDMDIRQVVQKDAVTGEPFVDAFTGMPDYRQTNFELVQVMRADAVAPTPWADFDRYGKYYYKAQGVDIAEFNGRTIAYIAYSLGGLVAVDITGHEGATSGSFLNASYLGYVPAVPANGPDKITGTQSQSLLPYYGAGMLKDSGVIDVKIRGDYAYLTDHFAGLMIVEHADHPETGWRGPAGAYNNDTDGILGNHFPDTEFITSYDMAAWNPLDNESMPKWMYQSPCLLVTTEINGHGNRILLMETMDVAGPGSVDLLACSGAGGFNFVDILNLAAPTMAERYAVPVYFPTTEEIGAKADGTAGQTISVGHSVGLAASGDYVYLSDGPHGISAWKAVDAEGYPTDAFHLVANTLQDEYPETVNGVTIYPASHAANIVYDPVHQVAWSNSSSLGLRRVDVSKVESGLGAVGAPLLLPLKLTDLFEHNGLSGTVKGIQYQDHSYDVEIKGDLAFTADGSNGLTVYDMTKDPTVMTSGFVVANIGGGKNKPSLGTASGIALWTDPATGSSYAFMACGPRGVGVVDVSNVQSMKLVKVFEPIKLEEGKVGAADGQSVDVKVVGNHAYFTYDSFGVVCYSLADLIAPLPAGIDPTSVWSKNTDGTLVYDYRPVAVSRFKLQLVPDYEDWAGGAVKMDYTLVNGRLTFYVAFAEAGLLKIDWTDPASPVLKGVASTVGECTAVAISNGRLFAADGSAGLLSFK